MGGLDKLKEAFGHSKEEEHNAPPPGYADSGYSANNAQYPPDIKSEAAPEYSIPSSSAAGGLPAVGERAGTLFFPARFGCYHKMFRLYLGTSKDNLLYTVSPPKLFGKHDTTLHVSADKNSPALATYGKLKGSKYLHSAIKVPPRANGDRPEEVEVTLNGDYELAHRFHAQVGTDRRPETFEWRNSKGREVRELGKSRLGGGYKLVRLQNPDSSRGGERKEREWGFTSEGEEIVAVAAHTNSWTSGPDFAFIGTGLTGAFGETWEIVAVSTWLRIVEVVQQQTAANGAAASSSAGAAAAVSG